MNDQLVLRPELDWVSKVPRKFYPCGGCGRSEAYKSGAGVACRSCGGYVPFGDLVGSEVQTRMLALRLRPRRSPSSKVGRGEVRGR